MQNTTHHARLVRRFIVHKEDRQCARHCGTLVLWDVVVSMSVLFLMQVLSASRWCRLLSLLLFFLALSLLSYYCCCPCCYAVVAVASAPPGDKSDGGDSAGDYSRRRLRRPTKRTRSKNIPWNYYSRARPTREHVPPRRHQIIIASA